MFHSYYFQTKHNSYFLNFLAIATATPINPTTLSQTSSDSTSSGRPSYPRTQYTMPRAHVILDQNIMNSNSQVESPYATHTPHSGYDTGPSATSGYIRYKFINIIIF